ncbi:MAG: hemolysin III family protein [Solirubrobacterales bacterium]
MNHAADSDRGPEEASESARIRALELAQAAREGAAEKAEQVREAAADTAVALRDSATDTASALRETASDTLRKVKPKFRGVSHEWAFFVSLGLGVSLIVFADTPMKLLAAAIYAVSLSALFGVSALYHRVDWKTSRARTLMRRLDHSMIFLLIAGTVTPFALLTISGTLATVILIAVWTGAVVGIAIELLWIGSPKWVSVIVYLVVGWIGAIAFPAIVGSAGIAAGLLIATGGILYTVGAVVYATRRPDPVPSKFGYHEVFHLLVVGAAGAHFAAVALFAL